MNRFRQRLGRQRDSVPPEQHCLVVAELLRHRLAERVAADDAVAAVVDWTNIPDRDRPVWTPVERHGTHAERHELRRVRVDDSHDVGSGLEDLAMQERFTCIVVARAFDRRALEVVLDHVAEARAAWGDKARHVPVVRIRLAARAHVRLDVENAYLARENPVRPRRGLRGEPVPERALRPSNLRLVWCSPGILPVAKNTLREMRLRQAPAPAGSSTVWQVIQSPSGIGGRRGGESYRGWTPDASGRTKTAVRKHRRKVKPWRSGSGCV